MSKKIMTLEEIEKFNSEIDGTIENLLETIKPQRKTNESYEEFKIRMVGVMNEISKLDSIKIPLTYIQLTDHLEKVIVNVTLESTDGK